MIALILLVVAIVLTDTYENSLSEELNTDAHKKIYQAQLVEKLGEMDESDIWLACNVKMQKPSRSLSGCIRLTLFQRDELLEPGYIIAFSAKLKKPSTFKNAGCFDAATYWRRKDVFAVGYVQDPVNILQRETSFFYNIQKWLKRPILKALKEVRPIESQSLLKALMWGEKDRYYNTYATTYRQNGLSHLLVISGLHFGVMVFFIYGLALTLCRCMPSVFLFIPGPKIASAICLSFVIFYSLLGTATPSLLRASLFISIYLLRNIFFRSVDRFQVLWTVLFFILLFSPADLFDLSFQLSFLSISLIFTFYISVNACLKISSSFLNALAQTFLLTVILWLGMAPYLLSIFYQVEPIGLITNLLMIPLFSFFLIPMVLIGLLSAYLSTPVAAFIFKSLSMCLERVDVSLKLAHDFLALPSLCWVLDKRCMLVLYALLFFCFLYRKSDVAYYLGLAFISWVILAGMAPTLNDSKDRSLEVTQLDVGQGDSLLVKTSKNKILLIDGGGSTYYALGERALWPYLLKHGLTHIDIMIVSHEDVDHFMGLYDLLARVKVDELWFNGDASQSFLFIKFLELAKLKGTKVKAMTPSLVQVDEQTKIKILWPFSKRRFGQKDNDRSLVFQLFYKQWKLLFTGDLEWSGEFALVEQYKDQLNSQFIKIGHHGSKTSSTQTLLDAVAPQIASIGVGRQNQFGHPHPLVKRRLYENDVRVFRTDLYGSIRYRFLEKNIEVNTFTHERLLIPMR